MSYSEGNYEKAIIELFRDSLGYSHQYGPDVVRDYRSPLLEDALLPAIKSINYQLPQAAVTEAVHKLKNIESGSLLQKNMIFMDYLQNGIPVSYFENGSQRSGLIQLIDFEHLEKNDFRIINQWTVVERSEKRADIVLFVNGLPLVVMELKSPSREETSVSEAYRQLQTYKEEIPALFVYNAICVMSDFFSSKAGTITSGEDRFMEWKTKDGSYENTQYASFDTFFEGLFEKIRFLDILKNFICFNVDGEKTFKILAGYHQYFAVKKAIESTKRATQTDGKAGVFWHTQGSGKSLSMVFYVHALQKALESPTIVVLTDRNDLDDQLYGQFSRCKDFLRQTPQQADSRKNLRELLAHRAANGIIFTTMQKFEEGGETLSTRKNIVVIADEAHRGHYGLVPKISTRTNAQGELESKTTVGMAKIIRDSLPNASFIGFTGTPISDRDRDTREVFGNYIDIYDMTQAVEDGATRPVYYESRVIQLKLDDKILKLLDDEYDYMAQNADPYAIEKSKRDLGKMEAILGAEKTIDSLVLDILDHYENYRANLLTGKAMIVAYTRDIAIKIYRKLLELRPDWTEKVGIVMTQGNSDPEDWRKLIGNKSHKEEMARKFKDSASSLKIAIVVDMWLTGFDVPSLATMYIYKPMQGHNLMQAIARVNRVFQDKEGGLVIDYVGIASALKQAMKDYTSRDNSNYGDMDIIKTALLKFKEKLSVCRDMMYGYAYSDFMQASDLQRAQIIKGAVNFILEKSKGQGGDQSPRNGLIKEALLMKQALSLCASRVDESTRMEAAFFETVRITLVRLAAGGNGAQYTLTEINDRINELLKHSIKSDGVINLFADAQTEFSIFDSKFLEEISKMNEKNLVIEILKKLLNEQISIYRRTNIVKSEKFSEIIKSLMNKYFNGHISNEEVIEELLRIADEIANSHKEGDKLGLTPEELAFYDALCKPAAITDFYKNNELIALTRELTECLRKNRTIDWQKKESARAGMRRLVKRLLKSHKYPPEGMEDAVQTVIAQCELWADAA